jgi:hypothetical protein
MQSRRAGAFSAANAVITKINYCLDSLDSLDRIRIDRHFSRPSRVATSDCLDESVRSFFLAQLPFLPLITRMRNARVSAGEPVQG